MIGNGWIEFLSALTLEHRLIDNRTVYIVFSRYRVFSVTITPRQKPKVVKRMPHWMTRQREHARNSFGLLPQGYFELETHESWKDDIQCSICIVINLCFRSCSNLEIVFNWEQIQLNNFLFLTNNFARRKLSFTSNNLFINLFDRCLF